MVRIVGRRGRGHPAAHPLGRPGDRLGPPANARSASSAIVTSSRTGCMSTAFLQRLRTRRERRPARSVPRSGLAIVESSSNGRGDPRRLLGRTADLHRGVSRRPHSLDTLVSSVMRLGLAQRSTVRVPSHRDPRDTPTVLLGPSFSIRTDLSADSPNSHIDPRLESVLARLGDCRECDGPTRDSPVEGQRHAKYAPPHGDQGWGDSCAVTSSIGSRTMSGRFGPMRVHGSNLTLQRRMSSLVFHRSGQASYG